MYLHSIGTFHPETVIDNKFLENLDIDTNHEWILERVGILERRTVLPLGYIMETKNSDPRAAAEASLFSNAQTGALAAKDALKKASLNLDQIGLVIAGGCSPQQLIPAEACTIARELNLEAPAFDISSACSSFAVQLTQLLRMRPETLPDYILVVNAENNTRTVDYSDRSTAVLWGDCTTAAIISPRIPGPLKLRYGSFISSPKGCDHVRIPAGGHFSQNGPTVQTFAVRKSIQMLKELAHASEDKKSGLNSPFFIGHQANLLMLQSVCHHRGISREKHLFNVDRFGNCGAAGAPSVLAETMDSLQTGDLIHLVVVGSGLTWGGLIFQSVQKKD